jgi:hypothetical protein
LRFLETPLAIPTIRRDKGVIAKIVVALAFGLLITDDTRASVGDAQDATNTSSTAVSLRRES